MPLTTDERRWLNRLRSEGLLKPAGFLGGFIACWCGTQGWCAETDDGTKRYWLTSEGKDALDAEGPHADGV